MRRLKNLTQIDSVTNRKITDSITSFRKLYIEINGDYYAPLGISEDDTVEITFSAKFSENRVLAFQNLKVETSKSLTFGIAYENFGELSISNGKEIRRFKTKDILLVGYVSAIMKPFKSPAIYEEETEPTETDKTEISVKCDRCGKEATGNRQFLSAMAWRIRANTAECAACW